MKKLLALTTTLSLGVGVFGVAGAAQAAVFIPGSTLNLGTSVQFNGQISQSVWNTYLAATQGPYAAATLNGTTDVYNGADDLIIANNGFPVNPDPGTVGFAPTIPQGDSSLDLGNPGNYILDASTPPPGTGTPGELIPNPQAGNVIDVEPGDIGEYSTTQQGTGTWDPIGPFLRGRIRSYSSAYKPNGLDANTAFISLKDGATTQYFSLDSFRFANVGSNAFQFIGFGRVLDVASGEIANVRYNYTTQELAPLINAADGRSFNITNASSLSMTITIPVPEPTGISGLIAATTLGLLALRKKKLQ